VHLLGNNIAEVSISKLSNLRLHKCVTKPYFAFVTKLLLLLIDVVINTHF